MKVSHNYLKNIETEKSAEFQLNLLNLDSQALGEILLVYLTVLKSKSKKKNAPF